LSTGRIIESDTSGFSGNYSLRNLMSTFSSNVRPALNRGLSQVSIPMVLTGTYNENTVTDRYVQHVKFITYMSFCAFGAGLSTLGERFLVWEKPQMKPRGNSYRFDKQSFFLSHFTTQCLILKITRHYGSTNHMVKGEPHGS
jgi:hypothetical protein